VLRQVQRKNARFPLVKILGLDHKNPVPGAIQDSVSTPQVAVNKFADHLPLGIAVTNILPRRLLIPRQHTSTGLLVAMASLISPLLEFDATAGAHGRVLGVDDTTVTDARREPAGKMRTARFWFCYRAREDNPYKRIRLSPESWTANDAGEFLDSFSTATRWSIAYGVHNGSLIWEHMIVSLRPWLQIRIAPSEIRRSKIDDASPAAQALSLLSRSV